MHANGLLLERPGVCSSSMLKDKKGEEKPKFGRRTERSELRKCIGMVVLARPIAFMPSSDALFQARPDTVVRDDRPAKWD